MELSKLSGLFIINMNLDSFFDDIDDVKPVMLEPECRYEIVITIYKESEKPITYWRECFDLEKFTLNNFINSLKEVAISSLLKQGAVGKEYFELIGNYHIKYRRTVFILQAPFSVIKVKKKFSLFIHVVKIQKEDCIVSIPAHTYERFELS